jgi:hypothetical protein
VAHEDDGFTGRPLARALAGVGCKPRSSDELEYTSCVTFALDTGGRFPYKEGAGL